MRYCVNCGTENPTDELLCPACAVEKSVGDDMNQGKEINTANVVVEDSEDPMRFVKENDFQEIVIERQSGGLNFLSFLYPVFGFVMYFDLRKNKPIQAHGTAVWAWIGVAFRIVLYLLYTAAMIATLVSIFDSIFDGTIVEFYI